MRPAFQLVAHDWNEIVVLQKASLPSSLCSIRLPMAVKVKHKTFYVFCCKNQALVVEDNMPRLYLYKHNKAWVVFYHCFFKPSNIAVFVFCNEPLNCSGKQKNFFMFSEFVVYSNFLCNFALNWSQSHFVCKVSTTMKSL